MTATPSFPFSTSLFPPHPPPLLRPRMAFRACRPAIRQPSSAPKPGAMMADLWLTYADASKRLGIKTESVKRRARSRKWARRVRNDGIAEVCIPDDALTAGRSDDPPVIPPAVHALDPALSERVIEAETRAAVAEARLSDVQRDRDHWRELAERLSQPRPSIWTRFFSRD
jgi:hypothetical protein